MTTTTELHNEANRLRKDDKYNEAISIYEKLWPETSDKYDGAGLLQCFRKIKLYEKALSLADKLIEKFPDFQWGKNEVIWTYIEGELQRLNEDDTLEKIIHTASKIMALKPEGYAIKMVVFKVLKTAKAMGRWNVVFEWTSKLNPEALSIKPMTDDEGREGWCDQSLWFNYRAKSLIETERADEVLEFIDDVIGKFPKQRKFFQRLKALAYYKSGVVDKAEDTYKDLCSGRKPDWWLLHEYALVLRDKGSKEEALQNMYRAANNHARLESMVTLFEDIGILCKELGKNEIAIAHYLLSSLVRREQGWSISDSLKNAIAELNQILDYKQEPFSLKEALNICRTEWNKIASEQGTISTKREPKRGLSGKVSLGREDLPFCFISGDDKESYFCFKADLPKEIEDGQKVIFNAIPSFDKKKNKESWKAVDVRKE